jgi:argininosuccinate lyase
MKTLWNGKSNINEFFKSYSFGVKKDWCLIDFEWKLQLAHVECLYNAKIVSQTEYASLIAGIKELSVTYNLTKCPNAPDYALEHEDIHSFVESKICELVGDFGKKIHTARSRNDQVATLIKMYLSDTLTKMAQQLTGIMDELSLKAEKYQDAPMPVTTHFQQAALGSIGHYLKMREKCLSEVLKDVDYLKTKNMTECPLGSGACVGSSIGINREIQADLLGFEMPSTNSLYSTTSRDEIIDYANICSKLSLHLINFIGELIVWSNQNFDWVNLPKAFCTGSSMMPNKLNPDFLELIRCDLKEFLVWPNKLLVQLSSLPSGYSRDLQIIKDDMFTNSLQILTLLEIFQLFLTEMEFKERNIEDSLGLGFIDATIEMERLVINGSTLRDAHHEIANQVQGNKVGSFCDGKFKEALSLYKTSGSPIN